MQARRIDTIESGMLVQWYIDFAEWMWGLSVITEVCEEVPKHPDSDRVLEGSRLRTRLLGVKLGGNKRLCPSANWMMLSVYNWGWEATIQGKYGNGGTPLQQTGGAPTMQINCRQSQHPHNRGGNGRQLHTHGDEARRRPSFCWMDTGGRSINTFCRVLHFIPNRPTNPRKPMTTRRWHKSSRSSHADSFLFFYYLSQVDFIVDGLGEVTLDMHLFGTKVTADSSVDGLLATSLPSVNPSDLSSLSRRELQV